MKILEDRNKDFSSFGLLPVGEIFYFHDEYYLKTSPVRIPDDREWIVYGAVSLVSGDHLEISNDAQILPLKAEIRVVR